jgi:integrase/recombinase XerD
MLVQRVLSPATRVESWTVLGTMTIPVASIERYLAYFTTARTPPDG